MKLQPKKTDRQGFTLIELLVVIAIIGVLVSLTSAAIFKILGKGPETQTRVEIGQMKTAIESFLANRKVDYIPSRIILHENFANYGGSQLEQDSRAYLTQVFGRQIGRGGGFLDWNGNGQQDGPHTLQGHQCLVFFLGGIPTQGNPAGTTGFSTSKTNPTRPRRAGEDRIGPFLEFETKRLVRLGGGFLAYKDAWENPSSSSVYAYFSSYGTLNGYNRYGTSDCASLRVAPYFQQNAGQVQYFSPQKFQIISPGENGQFGPGGSNIPPNAVPPQGQDDIASFKTTAIGNPE